MPDALPRFGDRRGTRIGLLGGSFNPAHEGHRHVANLALKQLRLDQVWLMVSPGNPLKPAAGMAPLAQRLASAQSVGGRRLGDGHLGDGHLGDGHLGDGRLGDRRIGDGGVGGGRRVIATAIEASFGTRYSVDTLRMLRRRFRRAKFVWIMGADLLTELPRWRRWRSIVADLPFAVLPRPGFTRRALAGQAARCLRSGRRPAHEAPVLAGSRSGWVFLPTRQNPTSATAIRLARNATTVTNATTAIDATALINTNALIQ